MRILAASGQLDVHGRVRGLAGRFGDAAFVVENIALARLKDDIYRVLADNRGKLPGRGLDQIAHGENGESDPSIHRRADLRVAEIDFPLSELPLPLHPTTFTRPPTPPPPFHPA